MQSRQCDTDQLRLPLWPQGVYDETSLGLFYDTLPHRHILPHWPITQDVDLSLTSEKQWIVRTCDENTCAWYAQHLDIHPLTARILLQRGFHDLEQIERFLHPSLEQAHDPFLMKDMSKAVQLILEALEQGKRIVIHGDYDVDGVSSVSVLYEFLNSIGANVGYFIPRRDVEGYGLSIETVRRLQHEGAQLFITTDCGISNVDEIQVAKAFGMQSIVVDHHTIPEVLPPADAILNPLQVDCDFPFKKLAAVGVTFNLVMALCSTLREKGIFNFVPEPDLENLLDLVALGTIADVVPLVDENRVFAKLGLEVLSKRRRAGISALFERIDIDVSRATTQTVSFQLAPRLNAAGRMGDASICVDLLTTRSYAKAVELANELESLNKARQLASREILRSASIQAESQVEQGRPILVLAGDGWNRGVLGIVASQLMEKYSRPAILIGMDTDGLGKGSARSTENINLIEALGQVDELLQTYGGHTAAAGLALPSEHVDTFKTRLPAIVSKMLEQQNVPKPTLMLDAVVDLNELNDRFLADIQQLEPFGMGNPEPVFMSVPEKASRVQVISKRHLRAKFHTGDTQLEGFGYDLAPQRNLLHNSTALAYMPKITTRRGKRILELRIKDLRPAQEAQPEREAPIEISIPIEEVNQMVSS